MVEQLSDLTLSEKSDYKGQRANARLSALKQKKARFFQSKFQDFRESSTQARKNLHQHKAATRKASKGGGNEFEKELSQTLKELSTRRRKNSAFPQVGKRKYVYCTPSDGIIDDSDALESVSFKNPNCTTLGDFLASKVVPQADEISFEMATNAEESSKQLGLVKSELEKELQILNDLCVDLHEHGTDGVVASVLKVMGSKPDIGEIQEVGLNGLDLWANNKGHGAIVGAGGLPLLLRAMKDHRDSEALQQVGCKLIGRIAVCSADCRASVASAGGVQAVLEAMAAHSASACVQELACQALKEFAARRDNAQNEIVASSGLQAVLQSMDMHASNAEIQSSACGVLRNICIGNSHNQDAILAFGGLQRVRKLMMEHSKCPIVQCAGIWTLFCLSLQNDAAKAEIVSIGSPTLIVRAMTTHAKVPKVQEAGCWALKELSSTIQGDIMRSDCIQALSSALSAHSGDDFSKVGRFAMRKLLGQTQTIVGGSFCKRRRIKAHVDLPTISE